MKPLTIVVAVNKLASQTNRIKASLRSTIVFIIISLSSASNAYELIRFAHVYDIASIYHQAAIRASEDFYIQTEGKYRIQIYPNSTRGDETEINAKLRDNEVDMIFTSLSFLEDESPDLAMSDYPYIFKNYDHWRDYSESSLYQNLKSDFEQRSGIDIYSLLYYGTRHVTANQEIRSPEDMIGLNLRIPQAKNIELFALVMGAKSTPISFPYVYKALKDNVVDAQENPLTTIQLRKFYELNNHINLTGHITMSMVVLGSKSLSNRLLAEEKILLRQVFQNSSNRANNQVMAAERYLVRTFNAQGINVNRIDKQPFIDVVNNYYQNNSVPWKNDTYSAVQSLAPSSE